MKSLVIYYSMSGNTEYVANLVSEKLDADLLKLIPKKEYPNKGLKKFLWGGKSAVMGETPELEDYEFEADKYDSIVFGSPVWASSFVPPIRTFIRDNKDKLNNKKISVFFCYMGGGADKAKEKLKKCLELDKFEAELVLVDPNDKKTDEKQNQIEAFCNKINENN